MRRTPLVSILFAVTACSDAPLPLGSQGDPAFGVGMAGSAQYEITITNLTSAQPFTPPLIATHRAATSMFTVGRPASMGISQIAENGNLAPLEGALSSDRHVSAFTIAFGPTAPPLLPGQSTTAFLQTDRGALLLSWVSMLVCTNDGFTGSDAIKLPRRVNESVMAYTAGYDAGSEINTEDWADLVPPCAQLTGFGDQGGTGSSNPGLAENGVIRHHPGILGGADLVPGVHGWTDPVAKIVVTRIE